MKGYIVAEVGFNYNDEYYYGAGDYGNLYEAPKVVYRTRERAEQEQKRATLALFFPEPGRRNYMNPFQYWGCDGPVDLFEEMRRLGIEAPEDPYDRWDYRLPQDTNQDLFWQILVCSGDRNHFWEIHEVEIEVEKDEDVG